MNTLTNVKNNQREHDRKIYSEKEKVLLMSLVDNYKHILENKKTDGTNLEKKSKAWKEITELYNSNDVCTRSDKQLKKLWDNLKQRTRKNDSEQKKHFIKTGGGPPIKQEEDPISELVRAIVPTISYTVENDWDSNSVILVENSQKQESNIQNSVKLLEVVSGNETDVLHTEKNSNNGTSHQKNSEQVNEILIEEILHTEQNLNNGTSNDTISGHFITPQKKRKRCTPPPSGCRPSTTQSLIEQEAVLRIKRLKRSMEQEEELHNIKKQAAEAEKLYWITKFKKLNE